MNDLYKTKYEYKDYKMICYELADCVKKNILDELCKIIADDIANVINDNPEWNMKIPLVLEGIYLGDVEVKYRSKYKDIVICDPSIISNNNAMIRIDFDDLGVPNRISCTGNCELFYPFLKNYPTLVKFANPSNLTENQILKKFNEVQKANKGKNDMFEAYKDVSRYETAPPKDKPEDGICVYQGNYAIAPYDKSIYTEFLNTCCALCILDDENKLQYLAHVDGITTPEFLLSTFKGIDITKSRIYIMTGVMISVETMYNIYQALNFYNVFNKVMFLGYIQTGDAMFHNTLISDGKVYSMQPSKKHSIETKNTSLNTSIQNWGTFLQNKSDIFKTNEGLIRKGK